MRGASVTVGRAAGDWEIRLSIYLDSSQRWKVSCHFIHLSRGWGLLDCPLFGLTLTFVLLVPIISGWVKTCSITKSPQEQAVCGEMMKKAINIQTE